MSSADNAQTTKETKDMAKKQDGAREPNPGETNPEGGDQGSTGLTAGKPEGGNKPAVAKPAEALAARICNTEATAREMFGRFALAVAGRDDANYRKPETIIEEAHALTALWEQGVKSYPDLPF